MMKQLTNCLLGQIDSANPAGPFWLMQGPLRGEHLMSLDASILS